MPAPTFLIGGGRDADLARAAHAPFLKACGDGPVLCVCEEDPDRWRALLDGADVRVADLQAVSPGDLQAVAGVYVAGGHTPTYAEALRPLAEALRAADVPVGGLSAGAAIAATRALVGGWRLDGRPVCPEEAGEDLDELTVVDGLGLVPFTVDVHAAQWGTVTRLVHAVAGDLVATGVAVDEHTCVEVHGEDLTVHGAGAAYRVGTGTLHVLTAS